MHKVSKENKKITFYFTGGSPYTFVRRTQKWCEELIMIVLHGKGDWTGTNDDVSNIIDRMNRNHITHFIIEDDNWWPSVICVAMSPTV